FDVIVGINLLREGLDLPEVALVAILDADKEGFLRSSTGLIQTIGRAARNVNGRAILYGDRITDSMRVAIDETKRRRAIQQEHNARFGITPRGIVKPTREMDAEMGPGKGGGKKTKLRQAKPEPPVVAVEPGADPEQTIATLKQRMREAAKQLEFEKAAALRDQIKQLEQEIMGV
ncbi:MAG: UvrB/UvrC motif-containing protein, partial [Myxococcota bacterium]